MTVTARTAERYGSLAPVTPLIIEIPMRGGRFRAEIRIPLDASANEAHRMIEALSDVRCLSQMPEENR